MTSNAPSPTSETSWTNEMTTSPRHEPRIGWQRDGGQQNLWHRDRDTCRAQTTRSHEAIPSDCTSRIRQYSLSPRSPAPPADSACPPP